jgi:hypothetical protein
MCDVTTYRLSPITYQVVKTLLKIFTQKNVVDLHSWYSPLTLATMVGGKHIDPVETYVSITA